MNQTRVFLIFAWLMVATLLWMEWSRQHEAPTPAASAATTAGTTEGATTPGNDADPGVIPNTDGLALPSTAPQVSGPAPAQQGATTRLSVTTDVLKLELDGSRVLQADLLKFPQAKTEGSAPVRLFNDTAGTYYTAGIAWVGGNGAALPAQFAPEQGNAPVALAQGQDTLVVPFVWKGADGVSIRRTFTFKRGQYAVDVADQVLNTGSAPFQGIVYRQLERVPPEVKSGMTNPESFSLLGSAWYSKDVGYQRRKFKDYMDDGRVDQQMTGGWIAMLQHHFMSGWIPQADDKVKVSLAERSVAGTQRYLISEAGPGVNVPPGQQSTTSARLWVGPKLVASIATAQVPGLDRAIDYSQFSIFAVIGSGLFWILSHIHGVVGNWGWAIIGLVVVVKLVLFPLANAQYRSAAKMRQFQPRLAQLKERYGDDRQKYQQAMMDLYKKEKINPMGGCLPVLVQMPIWLSLYWVLNESVELRQAPWAFWIHDLTARDPYFILPVLNVAIMFFTQRLNPAPGMDPTQQKIMMYMPLAFGVMMAFFPSGLVLYWVTNGALGLAQQWWMTRKYSAQAPAKAAK
jgi:YidC/Oxa1 family membrane protein insertase